ncbi:hypothetical protein [Chromatium okenii]|jgi:hypothetical protein|uniref:hypothetical protein n=1 Tax=Chromatium okenii TaxID=61644 RepID=UPI0026EE1F8B|nr:hypothetical protein [Chromatium okenii]MBV5308511.1 hypothetical protein [Chromatium okenii]
MATALATLSIWGSIVAAILMVAVGTFSIWTVAITLTAGLVLSVVGVLFMPNSNE